MKSKLALVHNGIPKEGCQRWIDVEGEWPELEQGEDQYRYLDRVRKSLIDLGLTTGICSGCHADMIVSRA